MFPHTAWPPEMTVTIEPRPRGLLQLLFLRSAWGLPVSLPALELRPVPDPGASACPGDRAEQAARWEGAWASGWRSLAAPSWWEAHGTDGVDVAAYDAWVEAAADTSPETTWDGRPERRCLADLVTAWRAGVDTIVELPYVGAPWRGGRHLAVPRGTRQDTDAYRAALRLALP